MPPRTANWPRSSTWATRSLLTAFVEIEQIADAQLEGVRAQHRIRHLLGQRGRRDDHDRSAGRCRRGPGVGQKCVERGDAQADEMGRRREVRLVGDAARGVVADRPRVQPGGEVAGQVAGRAVVGRDDDGRAVVARRPGHAVEQGGEQERPQRAGAEGVTAGAGELDGRLVAGDVGQQVAERHRRLRAGVRR
jgi:hypothetical protein